MELLLLTLISALVVIIVYVFFFRKSKEKRNKKSYYLKRFNRNKEQSIRHIKEVEALVLLNDAEDKKAFSDRDITFSEYLEKLRLKHENDYSESSYKILKRNKLSQSQKQEYTKKLIEQSEDLYLMEVDLNVLNKTWNKLVS
ncbi:hypothetical protein ACI6PS_13235 [Flavobacterium sp. PLA-1-15]|uniref:hypothetical protein n=1 Tax=Flavobacterium sp. PLA-1-15 TaxID=3380533 RepID=UPI003B7D2402